MHTIHRQIVVEWILEMTVNPSAIQLFQNLNITFHNSKKLPYNRKLALHSLVQQTTGKGF
jgi:hypothetical protein